MLSREINQNRFARVALFHFLRNDVKAIGRFASDKCGVVVVSEHVAVDECGFTRVTLEIVKPDDFTSVWFLLELFDQLELSFVEPAAEFFPRVFDFDL